MRRATESSNPLPTGRAKEEAVRSMFDSIAPRYDLVNRIMTFGLDVIWRRRAVTALALNPGEVIADCACGTGDFCRVIDSRGMVAVGFDLSSGMLRSARTQAPLAQADMTRLPITDGAVDGITCGYALRNVVDLNAFFAECARVVRPGGRIAFLEVSEPKNPLIRWGYNLYFGKVVPLIGGLISDRAAYRYLPDSVAYLPPTADMLARIRSAGFVNVEQQQLTKGLSQLITATRIVPAAD
jgi:demethylmenaquinone methyltransferase/2-methoxy-6-polyprenyl-1,4-benzoquinol methylase